MSDVNKLDLGVDLSFDEGQWDSILSEDSDKPTSSNRMQPRIAEVNSGLEIYKKAEHFKKLSLISGNSVEGDLKEYVKNNYGKEGVMRFQLASFVMKSLNFLPSPDVLLFLSCTKRARAVIATAGAGKTTSLQLDLIVSKMLDSVQHLYHLEPVSIPATDVTVPAILYLNYNKHNVEPISEKHRTLCSKVNSLIAETISDDIESSTVHSFCHKWLGAFSHSIELPELSIASDEDRQRLWTAVMTPRWTKFYGNEDCQASWETLDELYIFKVESMLEWESFFQSAKFVDTDLNPDFVKSCIKKYDSMKKSMKLMDFTDYLLIMIDVLRSNPELKEQVQNRYKIIVADENQDFTALMNELLLELYNPDKNRLIVVGDPDQTIYQFKGVSPDNIVNLVDRLPNCVVLGIDTNYRCPNNIVESAKRILSMNVLRFEKPIKTVRTGGVIQKHPIVVPSLQYKEALSILRKNGAENYGKTVITYRNNKSSVIIGEELYYSNIPFSVLDDRRPFNNFVFRHIQQALFALKEKDNLEANRVLFRFLPLSKDAWDYVLNENAKRRHIHLFDLIIPDNVPTGTVQSLISLIEISKRVDTEPCSDYIGALFQLYEKYYFRFRAGNPNPNIGDEGYYYLLLERTTKFWNRQYTYDYLMQELRERNVDSKDSVTLSTFHGLKGLEFDYVIVIDFNDNIFPNFFGIEQRYPVNTAMEEKESENRLCYVLVTRTIKELHLLYNESNPSVYVDILTSGLDTEAKSSETLSLGGIGIPTDTMSAKLSFIQRLTERRM